MGIIPLLVEQRKTKSTAIIFWKRFFGSLWFPFERERIIELERARRAKLGNNIAVSGYVKWKENSYIEVEGKVVWDCLRRVRKSLNIYDAEKIINVLAWKETEPEIKPIKIGFEEFDYNSFKEELIYRVEGLEPKISDFLAFVALSSPSFLTIWEASA